MARSMIKAGHCKHCGLSLDDESKPAGECSDIAWCVGSKELRDDASSEEWLLLWAVRDYVSLRVERERRSI
jgi:hypothetical protein